MMSPSDLKTPLHTETNASPSDVEADVIPIYQHKASGQPPSRFKLGYDIFMLVAIVIDLLVIFFDQIVMSSFFVQVAQLLRFENWLLHYKSTTHFRVAGLGGLFTLFLIIELLWRWAVAVYKQTYYRWFFFPFVHWYEVLGCFPLLRPLRLLRAIIIVKRLHDIGIRIIPNRWIKTAKFYGHILLEELSDRVILTAVGNFRTQLRNHDSQTMLSSTLDKNRAKLEHVLFLMLKKELVPKLSAIAEGSHGSVLSAKVGQAVEQAILETPELRRYLKMIPIAGSLIESQMLDIGRKVGENVASSMHQTLLSEERLDELMRQIAKGVSLIDVESDELGALIENVIEDALDAFEAQVKIQQWKHSAQLNL